MMGQTPAADVRTVQYMLRRNLGNYEHEEITLSGAVRDGADPMYAVNHLKTLAYTALYAAPEVKAEAIAQVLKTPVVAEEGLVKHNVKLSDEPKAEATFLKTTKEAAPTYPRSEVPGEVPPPIPQEAMVEEKPKRTRKAKEKVEEEMIEVESPYKAHPSEKSEEPKKVESAVVGKVEEKVQKALKTTPHISYDRTIKEHRSTFATYLNTNHKGWQTKKPQDLIVTFSTGLHGKPFMDQKGNILDSFKAELAAFFG